MQHEPPPADCLDGCLLRVGARSRCALLISPPCGELPGEVVYQGEMMVCYAVAFLFEKDYLLPQGVIDDFRRRHTGAAALEFMVRRGDAFPRADVTGRRVSNGAREVVFLKQLDLARPVRAFAYAGLSSLLPLAPVDAALWLDKLVKGLVPLAPDDARPPDLLRRFVPCLGLNPTSLSELPKLIDAVLSV